MAPALTVLVALLVVAVCLSSTAATAASPIPVECEDRIDDMSACLPYVYEVPSTASPSNACCFAFLNAAFTYDAHGEYNCICYLGQTSSITGYPINMLRLFNLFVACNADNIVDELALKCTAQPSPESPKNNTTDQASVDFAWKTLVEFGGKFSIPGLREAYTTYRHPPLCL